MTTPTNWVIRTRPALCENCLREAETILHLRQRVRFLVAMIYILLALQEKTLNGNGNSTAN